MKAYVRFLEAICVLTVTHLVVRFTHFSRLQWLITRVPVLWTTPSSDRARVILETGRAVGRAKRFYITDVKCLPSAAACTCLLRIRGIRAQLTIGVRSPPFEAHAWVELDGAIVNDDAGVTGTYSVITRV